MAKAFEGAKPPSHECFNCGGEIHRIKGKNGFFWVCQNKTCKKTFSENRGKPEKRIAAEDCPDCLDFVSPMPLRKGKTLGKKWASKFCGCIAYPDCKCTMPFKKSDLEWGIILTAILTTSSAITEDTGKSISSGIMAASKSYLAQGLKSNHSYQTTEAVDMAKALGGLKDLPEFIYVITDVNAHMADMCNRIWNATIFGLNPIHCRDGRTSECKLK